MSAAGHASSLGGPRMRGSTGCTWWLPRRGSVACRPSIRSPAAWRLRAGPDGQPGARCSGVTGRLALVAGPLVILTGLANSPLVVGKARELVASPHGNLLLAKALLVSIALAIGAVNHLVLRGHGRAPLRVLLGTELLVAAVAVMAGATMVTVQPGASRQPVVEGPSVHPAHFFGVAGPSSVHVAVSVPAPGEQSYQVTVLDASDGRPRSDVQKVFLTFTPPGDSGLPPSRVELDEREIGGLYGISGAHTPLVGEWGLGVTVRREGALDESVGFGMGVNEPGPALVAPPPDIGIGVPAPLALLWGVLPRGIVGWVPGLLAIAGVVAIGARSERLAPLRTPLMVLGVLLVMGAGSRSVVEAANRPTVADLAAYADGQSGAVEAGERIYLANCASCHGVDGEGDGPTGTLPAPEPMEALAARMSDAELSYRIANGLAGTPMPAFAASLTDQERRDLVGYLRQRWGSP